MSVSVNIDVVTDDVVDIDAHFDELTWVANPSTHVNDLNADFFVFPISTLGFSRASFMCANF